jgi:hypothetical protein
VVLADFKGDHMAVTAITENSAYTYYGETTPTRRASITRHR